jgi:hypothetical protein
LKKKKDPLIDPQGAGGIEAVEEFVPTLGPEPADDAALGFFPKGHGPLQNAPPLSGETEHPDALVYSRAAADKAIPLEWPQVAGEGGSLQPQTLCKPQERYPSKKGERNKHAELSPAQPTGTDGLVVDSTNRPGGTTEL